MRISFLLFLFVTPSLAFAIQGGKLVSTGSALTASTVALQFQMGKPDEWWPHCTAAIIAEDLAVTAAHCLPEASAKVPFRLAFTTDTTQGEFPTRTVTAFIRDEKFVEKDLHETDDHDLALVRFSGGLPPGVKPARLLQAEAFPPAGTNVIVSGFGSVNFNDYNQGILRWTTVKIAKPLWGQSETLLDQRDKGGSCSGDSGGPAYLESNGELFLWGITSRPWPLHVNDCGQYIIYSRLDKTKEWLEATATRLRNPKLLTLGTPAASQ